MEIKLVDTFEKYFPKVHERPSLQPYKDEIRSITMSVVKDILGLNNSQYKQYLEARRQAEMPYHNEL
jgi:hypothetical protein